MFAEDKNKMTTDTGEKLTLLYAILILFNKNGCDS